jgi:hypothetical protein
MAVSNRWAGVPGAGVRCDGIDGRELRDEDDREGCPGGLAWHSTEGRVSVPATGLSYMDGTHQMAVPHRLRPTF